MKRLTRWQWTLTLCTLEIAALLVAHQVLIARMAQGDTVSHILSAGPHVSQTVMATVIAFLVIRLLTVLALPGMILSRIGLVLMDLWHSRRMKTP
jgi:hypothetical protein